MLSHFCLYKLMSLYVSELIDSKEQNRAQIIFHRCGANSRERLQHIFLVATKSMKLKKCHLHIRSTAMMQFSPRQSMLASNSQ
jgi:hypothetical protein